jgi:hypothetical protein
MRPRSVFTKLLISEISLKGIFVPVDSFAPNILLKKLAYRFS